MDVCFVGFGISLRAKSFRLKWVVVVLMALPPRVSVISLMLINIMINDVFQDIWKQFVAGFICRLCTNIVGAFAVYFCIKMLRV